jgi:hypothetical protein
VKIVADIENLIYSSDWFSILLAGGMNSHFARNNRFTKTIKSFFDDKNLQIFWQMPNNEIQDVD